MCKVLGIAHSEYYYQRNKKEDRYKEANEKLDKEILKEYENSKGRYGSPKIQKALEKRGIRASQKRVARRMKKMGLKSIIVKKYRTSGSKGKVDDTDFLVYINAETGKEEDILVIVNTPNGTLTH